MTGLPCTCPLLRLSQAVEAWPLESEDDPNHHRGEQANYGFASAHISSKLGSPLRATMCVRLALTVNASKQGLRKR